jgi:hypothetical protein
MGKSTDSDLDKISRNISSDIAKAKTEKEKMKVLILDWGFKIAIASAILTILYPDIFTIYDYRAAEQVGEGEKLKRKTKFEDIWSGYVEFRNKVAAVSHGGSLREKDHYLFGKSRMDDLTKDLKNEFAENNKKGTS